MRSFVFAVILGAFAGLGSTTPALAQDADPQLTADLQKWLKGRWVCEYSRSMKTVAIFREEKGFLWIHSIGMAPYATVIRRTGTYDIVAPGNDGHQAAVLATIEGTMPEDPEFVPGKVEQVDFTRTGEDTMQDGNGECVRTE